MPAIDDAGLYRFAIKRFHDVGYSGWWSFVTLPPLLIATIAVIAAPHEAVLPSLFGIAALLAALWVLFGVLVQRGNPGPNRFGPDPLVGRPQ